MVTLSRDTLLLPEASASDDKLQGTCKGCRCCRQMLFPCVKNLLNSLFESPYSQCLMRGTNLVYEQEFGRQAKWRSPLFGLLKVNQ